MEVLIRVDQVKPPEGTIAVRSASDATPFFGWLELLRLLDDLLAPEGSENKDAATTDVS